MCYMCLRSGLLLSKLTGVATLIINFTRCIVSASLVGFRKAAVGIGRLASGWKYDDAKDQIMSGRCLLALQRAFLLKIEALGRNSTKASPYAQTGRPCG